MSAWSRVSWRRAFKCKNPPFCSLLRRTHRWSASCACVLTILALEDYCINWRNAQVTSASALRHSCEINSDPGRILRLLFNLALPLHSCGLCGSRTSKPMMTAAETLSGSKITVTIALELQEGVAFLLFFINALVGGRVWEDQVYKYDIGDEASDLPKLTRPSTDHWTCVITIFKRYLDS